MPFINRITVRLSQIALATTILTACTAAVSPAFGQTSQSDNPDWPMRSSEIHWPAGHTPADADLFAHNELLIRAPCKRVWPHLVDAPTLARVVFELSEREAAQ